MIEITTFRLREGVADAAFAEADDALQAGFFYQLPGLVRRTTARSDDGTWLALVVWTSDACAGAAADWASGAVARLIDPTTVETKRFDQR